MTGTGHCHFLSCVTCDNGLQLISTVKAHPELYDWNHSSYYEINRKEQIWDEIGQKLNTTGEECRNAWATLSAAYYTATAERKEKEKSGIIEDQSRVKWKFEDEMSFLGVSSNQTENSLDSNLGQVESDEHLESDTGRIKSLNTLKLFFEAMRETVRSFSPENQIIAKTQIFTVVTDLELREIDIKEIADISNGPTYYS